MKIFLFLSFSLLLLGIVSYHFFYTNVQEDHNHILNKDRTILNDESASESQKILALRRLSRIRDSYASVHILENIENVDSIPLQASIIESAGYFSDEKFSRIIKKALKDQKPEIRKAAIKALAKRGDKKNRTKLNEIITNEENTSNEIALEAKISLFRIESNQIKRENLINQLTQHAILNPTQESLAQQLILYTGFANPQIEILSKYILDGKIYPNLFGIALNYRANYYPEITKNHLKKLVLESKEWHTPYIVKAIMLLCPPDWSILLEILSEKYTVRKDGIKQRLTCKN